MQYIYASPSSSKKLHLTALSLQVLIIFQNPLVILVGLAAVVSAAPAPQSSGAAQSPVLVRNVDKDLEVQVVQLEDGKCRGLAGMRDKLRLARTIRIYW